MVCLSIHNMNTPEKISRRNFINHLTIAGTVVAATPLFNLRAQEAGKKFKVGVVGCGGRGSGAMENILEASKVSGIQVEIYSVADFFPDRAATAAKKYEIPAERTFSGPAAYHDVMAQPVDIVILATPPVFRPIASRRRVPATIKVQSSHARIEPNVSER